MTAEALRQVDALVAHIDRLEALHLAGLSPLEGQVLNLFHLKNGVRAALAQGDPARRVPWPTRSNAIEHTARRLVELVAASLAHPQQGTDA